MSRQGLLLLVLALVTGLVLGRALKNYQRGSFAGLVVILSTGTLLLGQPGMAQLLAMGFVVGLGIGLVLWQRTKPAQHPTHRVYRPPGFRHLALADFLFPPKIYTMIIEPTVSDMQLEYTEALSQERPIKARWILIRFYWVFWATVLAKVPLATGKWFINIWKVLT